ncbi:hypothetical protein GCM10007063_28460 [Lentibacillus kapialis]|uniref:Uncharacterized protein n=1 Tax=Lentibacillus kapialis TaxID=340214 RepID=A0A917Q0I6_9BACI|nr:hypothetical protein GCM10007063_28460 [Lentibacillus kapialis]
MLTIYNYRFVISLPKRKGVDGSNNSMVIYNVMSELYITIVKNEKFKSDKTLTIISNKIIKGQPQNLWLI